jgi:hypothetical protein
MGERKTILGCSKPFIIPSSSPGIKMFKPIRGCL